MDTAMLIGSAFEAGTETEEKVLNPKTGAEILSLPEASPAQQAAIAKALEGLEAGARTDAAE